MFCYTGSLELGITNNTGVPKYNLLNSVCYLFVSCQSYLCDYANMSNTNGHVRVDGENPMRPQPSL